MRDFHCFARSHKDNSQSLLWFRMDPKRDASAKTSLANSERCRAISASPPSVETNSHHGTTWRATFILQRASEYTARGISCSNIALHPPPAHALKIACAKTDVQTISYGAHVPRPFSLLPPFLNLFRPRCRRPRSLSRRGSRTTRAFDVWQQIWGADCQLAD
jgi:hypothetical protein